MKFRKLIIISPLGLILLVVVVAAWWFLGDDTWVKGKIEDSVAEMTGRSLSIEGAFSLDWSSHLKNRHQARKAGKFCQGKNNLHPQAKWFQRNYL